MTPLAYVLGLLGALILLVPYVAIVRRTDAALTRSEARVNELLLLLEASHAPNEVQAFLHPFEPAPEQHYLVSPDGLVSVPIDDDDD